MSQDSRPSSSAAEPAPSRRLPRPLVAGVAALAAVVAAALFFFPGARRSAPDPSAVPLGALPGGLDRDELNLVVITLDTTRADHLGAYGSKTARTPHLDRLAQEGVLFEQAMTTAPLTLPAHSSMFTAKFPPEHGVRDNGGFFLGPEQETLAEVLKARGYATGGFVAAFVLDSKWGIDQGFETYVDDFDSSLSRSKSAGEIQRRGDEVVDKALPWLESVADRRFFAFLHFYDPHAPYDPPEPFRSQHPGRPYDGEIAFTDAQVGRVIEFLEQRGLLEKTVVMVLGDHGESLGEHGENQHGFFIYEAAARVPFIVRAPFEVGRGRRVQDPVRVVDLMPTALELLGAPAPTGVPGRSLTPLIAGAVPTLDLEGYAEAMYPLHHYGWSELRALRAGRYKLIDAPRPELFDLENDPGELRNLFEERRALGERMVGRMRELEAALEAAKTEQAPVDVDPEVRARLAALGYVGSFVASAGDTRTDRADPKDKVHIFNQLSQVREKMADPDGFKEVVAMLTGIVDEDPQVIDAWFNLGNVHFKVGRFKEAITNYQRALGLKPDYDLAVINMAAAYRNLGDDEAAIAGFEHYLRIDPKDAYVRYQLGEIHLDRGEAAVAERWFREALGIDPRVAQAKNALAVLAFQRGNVAESERLVAEAIALRSDVKLARYNRALIAESRGDLRSAEREYLEELKLHPDSYKAAFNLSRIYEASGQRTLQVDALKMAIEGNPRFAEGHLFLAKAYRDQGQNLSESIELARKAVELKPRAELRPLAHYLLAELYDRAGRRAEALREAAKAEALGGPGA